MIKRPHARWRWPDAVSKELAPGVIKVPASWDIVEVKQEDGIVILEGPLTSSYSVKVIDDAQKKKDSELLGK